MRPLLSLLIPLLILYPGNSYAWNAAGHRIVALIAWQQLSPPTQALVSETLGRHPEHARWQTRARPDTAAMHFAESSTWPDEIRNDPRFYDEERETPTPPLAGLADHARHRNWHYIDVDRSGQVINGQLERRINELSLLLAANADSARLAWALPWLIHLVADIHQPLHVGHADDDGGTEIEIENPFNPRQPFSSLHRYWDDLPGPSWLRGRRLTETVAHLLAEYPAPKEGNTRIWREESHQLLSHGVYPDTPGSLLTIVTEPFHQRAQKISARRLVDAGYRLGWLLERGLKARVPRETQ